MFLPHISRFILWGSVGFICGVALFPFLHTTIDVLFFIITICSIVAIAIFIRTKTMWIIVFIVLMFGVGSMSIDNVLQDITKLNQNVGKSIEGRAVVSKSTVQKQWNTNVVFDFDDKNATVLIKDEKYTQIAMGDEVFLKCHTALPKKYKGFDYQMYIMMRGVDYVCDEFSYEFLSHNSNILSQLSEFRKKMESVVNNIIPAPQSALANGLLFGGDDNLSDEVQNMFAKTGMTHIVAVSGYNVSIIVAVVMGIVIFMGVNRRYSIFFAVACVLFFVALIGFPSSGVRAAVMGVLVLVAATFGRVSHAYSAIFFTGAVMIAFNPLLLRYDIGFQLSFLATLGIIAVYPILEKTVISKKAAFGILDILILTISAQIFVLPIIIYNFNAISIVSLVANLLILPIIPITMLFVVLLLVFSVIFYPLSLFFGWLAFFLLSYELYVIKLLANLPWSSIVIEDVSVFWISMYYIIIGGWVYWLNKKKIL